MNNLLGRAAVRYNNSSNVNVFFMVKNKIYHVYGYSSCRGYLYDRIQAMLRLKTEPGKRNRYFYIYYNGVKSVYTSYHRVSSKTVKLASELLGRMGYPPISFIKKKDSILIKLDISILKNLYATSLLFMLFKQPGVVASKEVIDFNHFLKYTQYNTVATQKLIKHWGNVFPERVSWKSIYQQGFNLHSEGWGELQRYGTKFKDINVRAMSVGKLKDKA